MLRHRRNGREHRDAGLAHRKHMRAGPHHFEKLDQMVDIFIDAEAARDQRDVARIVPVGDENVMIRKHGTHRRPQQRGEMAGQRRHQQHARLRRRHIFFEVKQRAERRLVRSLLAHFDLAVADVDRADAKGRAGMGQSHPRHQLVGRGQIADGGIFGDERLTAGGKRHGRPRFHRRYNVGVGLISEIQHPLPTGAVGCLATAHLRPPKRGETSAFFVALRQNCEHPALRERNAGIGARQQAPPNP